MDFTGQFRDEDDSMMLNNYQTPLKNITFKTNQDTEANPNSNTQTVQKNLFSQVVPQLPKRLFLGDEKKTNNKKWSLKQISRRVIEELKTQSITYKAISQKLTDEMVAECEYQDVQSQQKEIQNLRRRVYDALNVMISIGLVNKDNKVLTKYRGPTISLSKQNMIKRKLEIKSQLITKKGIATGLIDKQKNLEKLIQINKQRQVLEEQKIYFPFLAIRTELQNDDDDELVLELSRCHENMVVKSKHPLTVEGDICVAQKLYGQQMMML